MDIRTGKIFDMGDRGTAETVVGKDGRVYKVINGDNCTGYRARAFKRNCFIRAPWGRAKCKDFVPARRNG